MHARFDEPIRRTLVRNFAIAAGVGIVLALRRRDLLLALPFSLLALWFALGGHYVEIAFLNIVRPRIPEKRIVQVPARFVAWFVGGAVLYELVAITARVLPVARPPFGAWWVGGLVFIGVELVVHAVMAVRGLPNFYRGDL